MSQIRPVIKWLGIYALVLISVAEFCPPKAQAGGFNFSFCERVIKHTFGSFEYHAERVKKFGAQIIASNFNNWLKPIEPPEAGLGLTTEKSLELLRNGSQSATDINNRIRNKTYRIDLGSGRQGIQKNITSRREIGDGQLQLTDPLTRPRMEVLAFVIDRMIGFNMTAPSVMTNNHGSLQLAIPAGAVSYSEAKKNSSNWLQLSSIKLLDYIVSNVDREAPGNLLRRNERLVAIDFDLAQLLHHPSYESARMNLFIDGVVVEPEFRIANTERLPVITTPKILERMNEITFEEIEAECARHQIPVSKIELMKLHAAIKVAATTIEYFQSFYGLYLAPAPTTPTEP